MSYLLEYDDVKLYKNGDDTISLIVQRQHATVKILKYNARKGKKEEYNVRYYDNETKNMRSKGFSGHTDESYQRAITFSKTLLTFDIDKPLLHVFQFTIEEIYEKLKHFQWIYRIYRSPKNYDEATVLIDPYIMGVWLGDGHSNASAITSVDPEVIEAFTAYITKLRLHIRKEEISYVATSRKENNNIFRANLKKLNVFGNKHIPDQYKYNSSDTRLQVLAGLIDTDGNRNKGTNYDFIQSKKHEDIFDGVKEIAESLGFKMTKTYTTKKCTYKGEIKECPAVRGTISGDVHNIPVRVERKRITRIKSQRYDLPKFSITKIETPEPATASTTT